MLFLGQCTNPFKSGSPSSSVSNRANFAWEVVGFKSEVACACARDRPYICFKRYRGCLHSSFCTLRQP